jgi:hypothetical protein
MNCPAPGMRAEAKAAMNGLVFAEELVGLVIARDGR